MENKNVQRQAGVLGVAALAIVISLVSMPHPLSIPLLVAAYSAAVAIPFDVALFVSPDLVEGHTHPKTMSGLAKQHLLFYMIGFPAAFLCVAALLWHISAPVSVLFILVSLIVFRFLQAVRRAEERKGQSSGPVAS